MRIPQYTKLLYELFLDRRAYRGPSEFAFGLPLPSGRHYRVRVKAPGFCRTVALRRGTSDLMAFREVFGTNVYNLRRLARWHEILALYARVERPLILDLGANIGVATLYFAKNWPKANIVAVEPDEENFRLMRANLDGLSNVKPVNAAVASENGTVEIVDSDNPAWPAWSRRVEKVASIGPKSIPALSVEYLTTLVPDATPFLAKIDIEGFEDDLFSQNIKWVKAFPIIIIELHDWMLPGRGSSNNFLRAIANQNLDFVIIRENVILIANG
jgi:FkbM family methyltransferase